MIFLVEGLNCSGKSTWIDRNIVHGIDTALVTDWLNPLKWCDTYKQAMIGYNSSYFLGAYETLLLSLDKVTENKLLKPDVYLDRTFISGMVYGTINEDDYKYLLNLVYNLLIDKVTFVHIDTDVGICLDRLKLLRASDPKYKDYIWCDTEANMAKVNEKLHIAFDEIIKMGFKVKHIKNGEVK